ncbi:serine protease FAM111A-like [Pelmatolapia mariae]|uniref:serine protease FAM111A-like n=1 Tax=Pelmatolapia mariae TaxID=158779 RepID=UPI002FE5FD43
MVKHIFPLASTAQVLRYRPCCQLERGDPDRALTPLKVRNCSTYLSNSTGRMTSRNNPPRDNFKESTRSQDKENIPPPDLSPVAKEEEPHLTHSFEWSYRKNIYTHTCNQAQTIEDCLKKSPKFKAAAEKQEGKELVIVRSGKAIASHFPCRVIKNERLTLKFVKAVEKPKKPVSGSGYPCKKRQSSKPVIFHVMARGGKNVVRILKNPELRKDMQEITVYAYEGEKVKQALRRDGRFLNTMFKKNCVLFNMRTEVNTEMCNLVDDLADETFKIKLLDKSDPPESQPGSLDDAYVLQSESQAGDSGVYEALSQQTNTVESDRQCSKKETKSVWKYLFKTDAKLFVFRI